MGPTDPGRPLYEARLKGLQSYIAEVVAHKREHADEDLLSRLVVARDQGELSQEELDSMIFQLLVAGQEPVTNQITTALIALFRHPDQLDRLRDDPALMPRAVEELLRHDSAFELTTWRFFDQDSDLHGTGIPAGDSVIVSLCAANRDPRRFDDPDALDLDRSPNPHLAFGHGIHFCPGAALAAPNSRSPSPPCCDACPACTSPSATRTSSGSRPSWAAAPTACPSATTDGCEADLRLSRAPHRQRLTRRGALPPCPHAPGGTTCR